ncbi:MAG: hypothetical protein ACI4F1_05240, partial [Bariatricus sp.]
MNLDKFEDAINAGYLPRDKAEALIDAFKNAESSTDSGTSVYGSIINITGISEDELIQTFTW